MEISANMDSPIWTHQGSLEDHSLVDRSPRQSVVFGVGEADDVLAADTQFFHLSFVG